MKDSEFTIRARRKWVELYAADMPRDSYSYFSANARCQII